MAKQAPRAPSDLDDDDELGRSTDASVSRMKQRIAGKTEGIVSDDDAEVEIDPDADLDSDTRPETRKERRANRFREAENKRVAAESRAEALAAENTRLMQLSTRPQVQQPQRSPTADLDQELSGVFRDQEALFREYADVERQHNGAVPADVHEKYLERSRSLDQKKASVHYRIEERHRAPHRAQEALTMQLRNEWPDIYSNPKAIEYVVGAMQMRRARGEADSKELHDSCAQEARQVILGVRPAPDAAQRARASGVTRGGGALGAAPKGAGSIVFTRELKAIATAMYPRLTEAEAMQRWANKVGPKHLASAASRAK